MNNIFRHLLILALLSFSALSYADIWRYRVMNGTQIYTTSFISPTDACQQMQGKPNGTSKTFYYISNTSDTCVAGSTGQTWNYNLTILHALVPEQCPTGYQQEGNNCVLIPDPECPDGQFIENGQCVHGCVAGAEIKLILPMEQVQSSTIDPILGCDLNMSETKKPECNFNTLLCNVYYVDSGNYNDLFDADPEYEPLPEPDPIPEPVSTETVTGPTVDIQQNPDGSTVKTETTEITKLNDQGQTIELIGDSIVLKNKDGEIVDILQQTVTNTYTDGSKSITETVTTTATPSTVTEVKKNITDGSTTTTTRTYSSGPSGVTVTTKTETFDAQGNSTGKTETTQGSIDEVGEEEEGDYSYQSPGGKDGLYEKSDKTFESVLSNFVDEAQQAPFFSAATGFFNTSTSGTCPVWTIPSVWVFNAMVIDAQCSQVMNQIWPFIAAIVIAAAGFLAFRWAFL